MRVQRWARPSPLNADTLKHWVCTSPEKRPFDKAQRRKVHPKEWELEVQSHIRRLRPLRLVNEEVALGMVGATVVSVAHFGRMSEGSSMIFAIACAQAFKGQGIGRQALGFALSVMRHPSRVGRLGGPPVLVRIDPRNDASRAFFKASGFEFAAMDGYYELWSLDW